MSMAQPRRACNLFNDTTVGDACADTWLRIIVAIGELGTPSTDAQH
jgi:hypothetical protein